MNEVKIRRINYLALSTEGSLFFAGLAFIDANAVIPVFIYAYTHSLKMAGLATTLDMLGKILAQVLIGPYVKSISNLPRYMTAIMLIFRPLPLLMIPVLFSSLSDFSKVAIFFITYALFHFGDGLVMVPWTDLFGRTIEYENRGKVFGNQLLYGGLFGVAVGFLVKYLLENEWLSNTIRYSIIFAGAGLILIVSAAVMLAVKDFPHHIQKPPKNNWHYYAQLPVHFKSNPDLRQVAKIRVVNSITVMIAPLMILFGQETFRLNANQVSTLVYLQILGGVLGGIFWSVISRQRGNKQVILMAQRIGLAIPVIAILCLFLRSYPLFWYLLWPTILANGINMGNWVGFLNYTIDISTEENRTVNMLISNVISFPLAIMTFAAGLIADQFGFLPLLIVSILTAIIGIFLSHQLKTWHEISEAAVPAEPDQQPPCTENKPE